MVMIFSHPKVREYLLEHKLVYTFRKYHKKTADGCRPQVGKDWAAAKRTGKKIADIYVTVMEPIDGLNMGKILTKYARESGFYGGHGRVDDAVSEWARAINALNPDEATQGWIYKVEIREPHFSVQCASCDKAVDPSKCYELYVGMGSHQYICQECQKLSFNTVIENSVETEPYIGWPPKTLDQLQAEKETDS